MALGVILATDAYLRPGELLDLTTKSIIPAQTNMGPAFRHVALLLAPSEFGKATKTGVFNDSVAWTRTRARGSARCCNSGPATSRSARGCSCTAIGFSARRSRLPPPMRASEVGG